MGKFTTASILPSAGRKKERSRKETPMLCQRNDGKRKLETSSQSVMSVRKGEEHAGIVRYPTRRGREGSRGKDFIQRRTENGVKSGRMHNERGVSRHLENKEGRGPSESCCAQISKLKD